MPPPQLLAASAAGFCGGYTVGLVSWGGSQVIIPALRLLGLSQLSAAGTSLCAMGTSAAVSASTYLSAGAADLPIALCIALPGIAGARLGVRLASTLSADAQAFAFNGLSFSLVPIHMLVQHRRQNAPAAATSGGGIAAGNINTIADRASRLAAHAAFGASLGVVSALMGAGGGPLGVTYLTIFEPQMPQQLVQGTVTCAVVPGMLSAAWTTWRAGKLPLRLAAAATAAAAVGGVCGTKCALWLSDEHLRGAYVVSLGVLGGRSFLAGGRNLASLWRTHRMKIK